MRIAVAGSSGLIGSQVCRRAAAAGHEVVGLSRTDGVDLLDAAAVADALTGVEAVVDVSRPAAMDLAPARAFFTAEVAKALLALATGPAAVDQELAGPRMERLVGLVADLVAHDGLALEVRPGPAPASMAAGSMLPGAGVTTAGIDWHTWLARAGHPG